MRRVLAVALTVASIAACNHTVVTGAPPWALVKTPQGAGKIDLLFAIDDSPSMADKQALLADAIPTFLGRLVNPRCLDNTTSTAVPGDGQGCATIPNSRPEFPPVTDIHIAIVSSSLGGGGSPDVCLTDAENAKGHLLNRTLSGGSIANANPLTGSGGDFLAWRPGFANVTVYAPNASAQFITDFQALVVGVGQTGCGLEAQLESWYRFLIQPDPWNAITRTNDTPPRNQLDGVDATVLKMRKDFLRPDSLVAIIQLTDEEDSWSDPLWLGGYGWTNRAVYFPGGPAKEAGPRGTSECDAPVDVNNIATSGPNNPDCTSCAFPNSAKPVSRALIGSDPNCNACAGGQSTCPMKGWYTPWSDAPPIAAADGLNVRYAQQLMRSRYGFDSQFAVQRYIDALRFPTVPDRDHEGDHVGPTNYATSVQRNCTNPLFALELPDGSDTSQGSLCNLRLGTRTPERVYYALIGGVTRSLVDDVYGTTKLELSPDDWTRIVGKDPDHYLYDGIDPHMLQSTAPRSGLQVPSATYSLGTDPDSGREWNTLTSSAGIDLEYACTFDLPQPVDCTASPIGCDCATTAADGPPLCDANVRTTQIKGKAYPTIRELRVAKGLGKQSFVASMCNTSYSATLDGLVNRMQESLMPSCLPTKLPHLPDGSLGCVLVAVYANQTDQAAGCTDPGMSQPPLGITDIYADPITKKPLAVACATTQAASCDSTTPGWCVKPGVECPLDLSYTPSWTPPPDAQLVLWCSVTD